MKFSILNKTIFSTLVVTLGLNAMAQMVDMSGSFDNWRQIGTANWRIENGEFVAATGNGHLVTKESYEDFRIMADFWVNEGANSGIFFRVSNPDAIADTSAYEANIFDNRPDQSGRTGGIVNFAPPSEKLTTPDKWNSYDITVEGDHIVVMLNGVKTVDFHDSTYKSGPISLQYGAGTVKFRNVHIERL